MLHIVPKSSISIKWCLNREKVREMDTSILEDSQGISRPSVTQRMFFAPSNAATQPAPVKAGRRPYGTWKKKSDQPTPSNRKFIRHPTELPLSYHRAKCTPIESIPCFENSLVGLSFEGNEPVELGAILDVTVRAYDEDHTFQGQVVRILYLGNRYEIGLCFNSESSAFRVRMIEQICHIETYRRRLCEIEGCSIDIERAAKEWIEMFSAQFPKLSTK
jgi:hypothetical protein